MSTDGLLGRDVFLTALDDAFVGDRDTALLIMGERGIGRSACLSAARSLAKAKGRRVLDAAGSERETCLPFAGLHRLLGTLLESTDHLPVVQHRALSAALGMGEPAGGDSLAVRLAVMTLLQAAAAPGGLVVTLDDAQWLDPETRSTLAFAARRLGRDRMLFVIASAEPRDDTLLGNAGRLIRLTRLGDSDAHRLLGRLDVRLDPAQRRWVVDHAAGNPLALRELATSAASLAAATVDPPTSAPPLTDPLVRAFAGRVQDLSPAARDAALVAALAADATLPIVLAGTTLLRGVEVTAEVLEAAQAMGVLTVDEHRVEFAHPLVRAAIVQQHSMSRRQAAHRALGGVVTQTPRRRAWHRALGTAVHNEVVAAELEATTLDSVRRGDVSFAIVALERAAQLSERASERGRRLLLAAGHAARLGRAETALRLVAAAADTRLSVFDQARAELIREDFEVVVIANSERVVQLCALARRAAAAGDRALHLDLVEAAARRRCAARVDPTALRHLADVTAQLIETGRDARTIAVLALADPVAHGRTVLAALPPAGETASLDGDELTAYGVAARAVGDYAAASRLLDRAEVALRARGLLGPLARNLAVAADLRIELGDWNRAAAALVGFAPLSSAAMSTSHRFSATLTEAKIEALRGSVTNALQMVTRAEHSAVARSGSRFLARAQIVRGIACISAGRHNDAWVSLSRVFDPSDASHHFREQFDAVAYLAEAAAHTGKDTQARRLLAPVRRAANTCGSPTLLAHLAYADAVLATDDAAEQSFLRALVSYAGDSSWHRARVQLAYGRWLRRRQRVSESRVPLQSSLTIFRCLGAARWIAEAEDELAAAGITSGTDPVFRGAGLLSAQEAKIANLAAQGLTNKEIGEQLYLSSRTVSSHLYRLFPKLGITTRGQLAARLARNDLEGSALPT